MPSTFLRDPDHDAIEQMRARGWDILTTAGELQVPVGRVKAVWARMDRFADEGDLERPALRRRKRSRAIPGVAAMEAWRRVFEGAFVEDEATKRWRGIVAADDIDRWEAAHLNWRRSDGVA